MPAGRPPRAHRARAAPDARRLQVSISRHRPWACARRCASASSSPSSPPAKGTGLGLAHRPAHRREPLRASGGPQPGQGTTFTVRLPCAEPSPTPSPPRTSRAAGPAPAQKGMSSSVCGGGSLSPSAGAGLPRSSSPPPSLPAGGRSPPRWPPAARAPCRASATCSGPPASAARRWRSTQVLHRGAADGPALAAAVVGNTPRPRRRRDAPPLAALRGAGAPRRRLRSAADDEVSHAQRKPSPCLKAVPRDARRARRAAAPPRRPDSLLAHGVRIPSPGRSVNGRVTWYVGSPLGELSAGRPSSCHPSCAPTPWAWAARGPGPGRAAGRARRRGPEAASHPSRTGAEHHPPSPWGGGCANEQAQLLVVRRAVALGAARALAAHHRAGELRGGGRPASPRRSRSRRRGFRGQWGLAHGGWALAPGGATMPARPLLPSRGDSCLSPRAGR